MSTNLPFITPSSGHMSCMLLLGSVIKFSFDGSLKVRCKLSKVAWLTSVTAVCAKKIEITTNPTMDYPRVSDRPNFTDV